MQRISGRASWFLKLAVGVFLFWFAFRDVEIASVARAFAIVDLWWLAAATLSVFLTVGLVTARWRVLIGRAARHGHMRVLMAAVIASQVANIAMPFRLGDAVRIGAVSRALNVPPAEILGSIAVERLLDAILLAGTALLLVVFGTLPPFAHAGMVSLAAAIAVALVLLTGVLRLRPALRLLSDASARVLPVKVHGWLARQAALAVRGLMAVAAPAVALSALLLSAAVMSASILTTWLVLRAFHIDAPAVSAAVIVMAVQIGSVAVPVPGAIGVSQILTVQTLHLWDVPEAPALAYALMLFLVSRVPKLAVLPFALSVLTPNRPPG